MSDCFKSQGVTIPSQYIILHDQIQSACSRLVRQDLQIIKLRECFARRQGSGTQIYTEHYMSTGLGPCSSLTLKMRKKLSISVSRATQRQKMQEVDHDTEICWEVDDQFACGTYKTHAVKCWHPPPAKKCFPQAFAFRYSTQPNSSQGCHPLQTITYDGKAHSLYSM